MSKVSKKVDTQILLIEDDDVDVLLIRKLLDEISASSGQNFMVRHADRLQEAEILIRSSHSIDIILLDLSLPDSSGLNSVARILECSPAKPIVVVTGLRNGGRN